MNPRYGKEIRRKLAWTIGRISMTGYGLWMAVNLSTRKAVDYPVSSLARLGLNMSPRRAVAYLVLAAMIVTPTVLYIIEHGRYVSQRDAYWELLVTSGAETRYLQNSMEELLAQQVNLTGALLDAGYAINDGREITVKVVATGYSSSIWETDDTPFITAANTQTREGILALSRDLLKKYTHNAAFRFGDHVHVTGLGDFLVEDTMHARWTNRVDVWFASREQAIRFGTRDVYLSTTVSDDPPAQQDVSNSDQVSTSASGM